MYFTIIGIIYHTQRVVADIYYNAIRIILSRYKHEITSCLSGSKKCNAITDGDVSVSNGVTFFGSGQAGSYFMLVSAQNDPNGVVINISNNALGVIYYANNGKIHFSNNATAKEATGYGIELDNNASITYESGLANINFSSGPSGGWDIRSWQEVIP